MKELKLTNNIRTALVDEQDFERLSKYKWHVSSSGTIQRTFYISPGNTRQIALASEIMNDINKMFDHKDVNSFNNQRNNLRPATSSQNNVNKLKRKGTTSSFIGVCFIRKINKWYSQISKKRKKYHLGYFDKELDAAIAYDLKAIELHGEFARLNFPVLRSWESAIYA